MQHLRGFQFPVCGTFHHPHQNHEDRIQLFDVAPQRKRRGIASKGSRIDVTTTASSRTKKQRSPAAAAATKAPQKTKKRRAAAAKDPPFWTSADDTFVYERDTATAADGIEEGDSAGPTLRHVQFMIHGNPLPLRRHRTSRGFVYNPSAPAQECFRTLVKGLLQNHTTRTATTVGVPLFSANATLAVTLHFRMKRPLSHWIGSKRGPNRLRPHFASSILHAGLRTDVDNLAKFVLDSLNEIAYEDDRQVVSLHATKVYDSIDDCLGSTVVCMRLLDAEEQVQRLLGQSLEIAK